MSERYDYRDDRLKLEIVCIWGPLQRCQMRSAFMSWPNGIDVKTSSQVTAANEMFAFRGGRPRSVDVHVDFLITLVIKMYVTSADFVAKIANT